MPPKGWRKDKSSTAAAQAQEIEPDEESSNPAPTAPAKTTSSLALREEELYYWTEDKAPFPRGTQLLITNIVPIRAAYTRPDGTKGTLNTDEEAFSHFPLTRTPPQQDT